MLKVVPRIFKLPKRKDSLWTPPSLSSLWRPGIGAGPSLPMGYIDPKIRGYDDQIYQAAGEVVQERDVLDYASAGSDSVELSQKGVITAVALVADPYQHDVTTAVITVVQDAVDKVISGLNISGGGSYFSLNNTTLYMKALSSLNKKLYNLIHQDLATAVAADHQSNQVWFIPFGVFSDYDPFDASAGIPAIDETSVELTANFGANNIIAVVAADGTVDVATDIYVVTFNVIGLPPAYRSRLPIPDFRHDHIPSPTTNTRFDLQVGRTLKRTTIVNLAAVASNNEDRNDANVTDVTVVDEVPTRTTLFDQHRWEVMKGWTNPFNPDVSIDRDGSAAIAAAGLDGVVVIDWRHITHNPFGLNLYSRSPRDVHIDITMGVTTGSIHLFNEYYALPDRSVYDFWSNR